MWTMNAKTVSTNFKIAAVITSALWQISKAIFRSIKKL